MSGRRRRFVSVVIVILAVVFVVGLAGWLAFGTAQIPVGMARADVEARLGPPTGNMLAVGNTPVTETTLVWHERKLVITFDNDGRVRTVSRPPTAFDSLRSMLGL